MTHAQKKNQHSATDKKLSIDLPRSIANRAAIIGSPAIIERIRISARLNGQLKP